MRRVLVIEDNPVTQILVSTVLDCLGHEVVEATDGEHGTELFNGSVFDLVITDFMMPKRDGLATLRAIRHRNARVPILAMSGHANTTQRDGALSVMRAFGANDTIPKPFDLDLLTHKINTLLDGVA